MRVGETMEGAHFTAVVSQSWFTGISNWSLLGNTRRSL